MGMLGTGLVIGLMVAPFKFHSYFASGSDFYGHD
jgi:hypothetical protein